MDPMLALARPCSLDPPRCTVLLLACSGARAYLPVPAPVQVQQLNAQPEALDALASPQLEELEATLNASIRAVRDALLMRKVDEAQRRSGAEQNQCTLCMEVVRSVAFGCGHQACEPCSSKLAACPFCRATITAKIRLYDA